MSFVRLSWFAVLLLAAAPVTAQSGPAAEPRWADDDPAAKVAPNPDPRDRGANSELERVLRRDPGNVPAHVLKGRWYLQQGQHGRATDEFEKAIAAAPAGSVEARYARWNFGWALFDSADPKGALAQWRQAAAEHGGHPYWLPAVTALVLWMQGDRDGAIDWYAAAARSDPARWQSDEQLSATTREWSPNARFTLESIRQAWRGRFPT